MNPHQGSGARDENESRPAHYAGQGDRQTVSDLEGNEPGAEKPHPVAESHIKKEGTRLTMTQVQFTLDDREKRGQNNSGHEIKIEDRDEKEERDKRKGTFPAAHKTKPMGSPILRYIRRKSFSNDCSNIFTFPCQSGGPLITSAQHQRA